MFDAPNHPIHLIRKYACCINEEARLTAMREVLIETLESNKQNKEKRKEKSQLKFLLLINCGKCKIKLKH